MPSTPFAHIWIRLETVGFPKSFVKERVLPDWWDEEMVLTQAGYEQSVALLATRLGLTHDSLRDESAMPTFRKDAPVCFKLKDGTTTHEVTGSQAFAVEVARVTLKAVPPHPLTTGTASEVREAILSLGPSIDLAHLLDWCWQAYIPVLHVDCRKVLGRTQEAMAIRADGRYAIVLNRHAKSRAWLLFHLAHELGHLLLGHLDADGVIADEGIADGATGGTSNRDAQEHEANDFAVALLTGSPRTVYKLGGKARTETLVAKARLKGEADRLNPASVVLLNTKYLREQLPHIDPWGRAARALSLLEPEADAPAEINAVLSRRLDWSALTDDQADFLTDLLEVEPEAA